MGINVALNENAFTLIHSVSFLHGFDGFKTKLSDQMLICIWERMTSMLFIVIDEAPINEKYMDEKNHQP